MTEDEAKTKWCPFVRTANATVRPASEEWPGIFMGTIAVNRSSPDAATPAPCIASECMAWRWIEGKRNTEGYCGLAGAVS